MTRNSELHAGRVAGALPTSIQREMFGSAHVVMRPEKIRSDDELFGFLYSVRGDGYYKDSLGLSLSAVAQAIGIPAQNINNLINERHSPRKTVRGSAWKTSLSHLIDDIESGRVGWTPGRTGPKGMKSSEHRFEPPVPLPSPQAPLVLLDDWNWWAPCRACFLRRYQVLLVGGRYHCACARCVDPLTVGGIFEPRRLPLPAS